MTRDEKEVRHRSSAKIVSTFYPASPPLEESIERFYQVGPSFASIEIHREPPDPPLELLEQLGPSPFPRGGFPVIGFLATTYDKVGRYGLERLRDSAPRANRSRPGA